VELLKGQVLKKGRQIDLTAGEYKLLCLFMQNPNTVLSAEHILNKLWDCEGNFVDNNTLTVYIRRLRTKIEDNPSEPKMITTIRRMGYKWNIVD
jgi:DNA-binding response OmpR family regulator